MVAVGGGIVTQPEQPLGYSWLYQAIQDLRAEVRDGHTRMRTDMNAGFDKLDHQIRIQNGRVNDTEDRLLVIETERKAEAAEAIKKGTLAGMLGAGGLAGVIEAFRQWWP